MNPYIELGVLPSATFDELKQAYRQAVLRYHPDTAKDQGNPEKFNTILQAYSLLRKRYEGKRMLSAKIKTFTSSSTDPLNAHSFQWKEKRHSSSFSTDRQARQLSFQELLTHIRESDNMNVKKFAIETLVMRKNPHEIQYLINLLSQADETTQHLIVQALGQKELHQANSALFSLIFSSNVDISFSAIKSLEKINQGNRKQILQALKRESLPSWKQFLSPVKGQWLRLKKSPMEKDYLGNICMKEYNLSEEQVELSLLLQKRCHLLLGQIFRELDYMPVSEIQKAISKQKYVRRF
ncbi:DnaJ domain-containing protein [Deltaproteobacteria bacterium TL4]